MVLNGFCINVRRFLTKAVLARNEINFVETTFTKRLHSSLATARPASTVTSPRRVCVYPGDFSVCKTCKKFTTLADGLETYNREEYSDTKNLWSYDCYIDVTLYLLRDIGLQYKDVATILRTYSESFKHDDVTVEQVRAILTSFAFSYKQIKSIIKKYPQLLFISPEKLQKRLAKLLDVGEFSSKNLPILCVNAPCVIFDDVESTQRKLTYLAFIMSERDNNIIAENGALNASVFQLEMRHQFLYRRGQYFKQNRHGSTKHENPSLRSMFCTNVSDFCSNVAKCSEEEYHMFEQLFSIENSCLDDIPDETDEFDVRVNEDDDDEDFHNHKQNSFANDLLKNI